MMGFVFSGTHGTGGVQVRSHKKPRITIAKVGQRTAVKRRLQGKPRAASHFSFHPCVCCENFIFHPPNSFELSQGNLLSLNVKSWPENWNEILGFKDWNLSELVDLPRDGGCQGGHYHDVLDNGRNAGGQVCNQITNCSCAELQFKLLISQRLTLCENTNYNRQLMFSLKSNRQSFFINIFLRHIELCSFVRTWKWKLGIKFDLFSPALTS